MPDSAASMAARRRDVFTQARLVAERSSRGKDLGLEEPQHRLAIGVGLFRLRRLGPRRRFGPARGEREIGAGSSSQQEQADKSPCRRQGHAVLAGEFAQLVSRRRRASLDRVAVRGSAGCRGPGRWPSRTAGSGPSQEPSSRSNQAHRGAAWSADPVRSGAGPRSMRGCLSTRRAACSAWAARPRESCGGSRCRPAVRSLARWSGVVPVNSSYSTTPSE